MPLRVKPRRRAAFMRRHAEFDILLRYAIQLIHASAMLYAIRRAICF